MIMMVFHSQMYLLLFCWVILYFKSSWISRNWYVNIYEIRFITIQILRFLWWSNHVYFPNHLRIFQIFARKKYMYDVIKKSGWLVIWVYGISTFVGYLMPNPFLYK